jgi:hypothetical protein
VNLIQEEIYKKVLTEHKLHYTKWSIFPVLTYCTCGHESVVDMPEDILAPEWNTKNEDAKELKAQIDHQFDVFFTELEKVEKN